MTEHERYAVMMQRSAELKRRIAVELADAVVAVVGVCETSLRGGGKLMFCGNGGARGGRECAGGRKADVLRQWRVRGRQPASGDRDADPAARLGGATVLAGPGAD